MINSEQNEEEGVRHTENNEEEDEDEEAQNTGFDDEDEPHYMRQPRPGYIHAGKPDIGLNGILKKKNFFKNVVITILLLLLLVCFIPFTYFLIQTYRRSEQNFMSLQSDDRHVKKPQTFRQLSEKSKETSEDLDNIKKEMVKLKSWNLREITSLQTELLKVFEPIRKYNEEFDKIYAYQKALDNWKETINKQYENQMRKLISQQARLKDIVSRLEKDEVKTSTLEKRIMKIKKSSSSAKSLNSICNTYLFCLLSLCFYLFEQYLIDS